MDKITMNTTNGETAELDYMLVLEATQKWLSKNTPIIEAEKHIPEFVSKFKYVVK